MSKLKLVEEFTSSNLYKKINSLNEEQVNSIEKGLVWTTQNVPNAVLVGGTAVVNYISGSRDLTPDLDFMVNDVDSVKSKLNFNNINYKELNPGYSEPIGITVDILNTDYLDSNIGNSKLNNLILSTPNTITIGGYSVKIVNPELLAIMKLEVGRDKDVNDAFKLLSSGKVSREKYLKYLYELKNSLSDYESILNYKNFIE